MAVWCMLRRVAACCSVLQRVAACCSVFNVCAAQAQSDGKASLALREKSQLDLESSQMGEDMVS